MYFNWNSSLQCEKRKQKIKNTKKYKNKNTKNTHKNKKENTKIKKDHRIPSN